ncbi:MAG: 2-dehydropantoate 2-reductase [Betaproteobacteria bacterium]
MRISIIGAGGVGGYFGGRLANAGEAVVFIARGEHLAALRREGLRVRSASGDLALTVEATDDPAAAGPADVVMIATKLWSTGEAIAAARALLGPAGCVVSFQNGIEAEERLVEAFGAGRVLGGVANIAAAIESPGVIRHTGTMAMLQFGELDNARSARVEALLAACQRAGIEARVPEDIHKAIWEKFVFLASLSGMTALVRLPLGPIREDAQTRALFRQLAAEVVAVGVARGVALDEATVELVMKRLDALPPQMHASMLGDLQRGLRLELPWLSGAVVREGERLGVATPGHRFVYVALKLHANGRHEKA